MHPTTRRRFLTLVAAFFASINPIVKVGSLLRKAPTADGEFLIVNGWVLKRDDLPAGEVERDAV
jgi:hypothetical protein